MYVEGKNNWKTSSTQNKKVREMEVAEIENGFLCKICEYNEYSNDVGYKEDRKEKIVYSKTNPLEGKETTKKDEDMLGVSAMLEDMAKQMGSFLVK